MGAVHRHNGKARTYTGSGSHSRLVATKDVCMNGSTRYIACVATLSGVRVGTTKSRPVKLNVASSLTTRFFRLRRSRRHSTFSIPMAPAPSTLTSLRLLDPIHEMAAIALHHGVGMHVDGCLGGFITNHLPQHN